jgi:transcriptional regulator with XRE-family HTH domain
MKPSEVFGLRLRETRRARDLTQAQLASLMTENGIRMSKVSLLEIEKATRGLLLDEALALAAVLNAVPAHLLTPPQGAWVALTSKYSADGSGVREFLRHGFPWHIGHDSVPEEARGEARLSSFQLNLARIALALVDARRGGDNHGVVDAVEALVAEVNRREAEKRNEVQP